MLTSTSSTIIEHMNVYCSSKPDLLVAYFYFDFNDDKKQNAKNFLSSLIAQICSKMVNLPKELKNLYFRCNDGEYQADMPSLIETLKTFAVGKELQHIFIVGDALDECPMNERDLRTELLDLLTEIRSWSMSNIHLLVTSRQERDIMDKLLPLLTAPAILVGGPEVKADIKKHIEYQIVTDSKLKGWSDDLKAHIVRILVSKANGM